MTPSSVFLSDHFQAILGGLCVTYSKDFARRSMADLAFSDADGLYYMVDVKTHRLKTSFNMPNLTSVERLVRFYEDDKNYFVVCLTSTPERSPRSARGLSISNM